METFKIAFADKGELLENKPLKAFTTWKVGGPAKIIFFPFDIDALQAAIQFLIQNDIAYRIIGRGSNMLISDEVFDGVIIILSKMKDKIVQESTHRFTVSAGFGMQQFSRYLAQNHYKGHEFFSGIPGSIGGGIVMNAGTPKGEFKDVLVRAQVVTPTGEIKWMSNEALQFAYRTSFLKKNAGYAVLSGDFYFELEDAHEKGTSIHTVKEDKLIRRSKQPLSSPNSGSVFKNPATGYAGQYIESLGLKGYKIGGAKVSTMHANFIINTGDATAADIYALIRYIQHEVKAKYDVVLETEVELLNFDE